MVAVIVTVVGSSTWPVQNRNATKEWVAWTATDSGSGAA
jgi:hypothetical protein